MRQIHLYVPVAMRPVEIQAASFDRVPFAVMGEHVLDLRPAAAGCRVQGRSDDMVLVVQRERRTGIVVEPVIAVLPIAPLAAIPLLILVLADLIGRPQRIRLDREVGVDAPRRRASKTVTLLRQFFQFGLGAPRRRRAGGIAARKSAGTVQITRRSEVRSAKAVFAPALERGKAVLLPLHAGGDGDGKIVCQMPDIGRAAAIAEPAIVGHVFGFVVVFRSGAQLDRRAIIIERIGRANVDGGGDTAGNDRRILCLVHDGSRENFRGIDLVANVLCRLRGRDFTPVDQAEDKARTKAADRCLARIAAVALCVYARQAIELFGDRHVRKLSDILRRNGIGNEIRFAFHLQRIFHAPANAGNRDLFDSTAVLRECLDGCGAADGKSTCAAQKRAMKQFHWLIPL